MGYIRREDRLAYYRKRIALGTCPICPNEVINPRFAYCFKCRKKRARYQAKRRKDMCKK